MKTLFKHLLTHLQNSTTPTRSTFHRESLKTLKINMSLSLEGIGAVLKSENEFTQIVRLVPAGPADKTGLLESNR